MTRRTRPGRRTLTLLLRNARGRFMRVLPTIEEVLAAKRPRAPRRPRPAIVHVQLALF
jgi:hypothetical protein